VNKDTNGIPGAVKNGDKGWVGTAKRRRVEAARTEAPAAALSQRLQHAMVAEPAAKALGVRHLLGHEETLDDQCRRVTAAVDGA